MARRFSDWFSGFRKSIATYEYYVDFKKAYRHVGAMASELNELSKIVGSQDIRRDFEALIAEKPEVLRCIPLLLAVRSRDIYCRDAHAARSYAFDPKGTLATVEQYSYFMEQTGLFDLLRCGIVGDLSAYVLGVEVGLDSNARKNRGGHLMEDLVESYIEDAGFKKDRTYFKEMKASEIERRWNVGLSSLTNHGKAEKRFDFVVAGHDAVYAIEANFYAGSGSKLNEVARSYKTLALESKDIPHFQFVWFTDGEGWTNARHNLEEAFDSMEHLYNIADMEKGIISKVCR